MKKKQDEFTYEIPNYDKYNPRADYKSIPWIRLEVATFDDPRIARVSTLSKLLYIYLLTAYGRPTDGLQTVNVQSTDGLQTVNVRLATVNVRLATAKLHSRADRILLSADELELNQLIKIHSRTRDVRYERYERYERNERNERTGDGVTDVSETTKSPPQKNVENIKTQLPVLQSKPVLQNASATKLFSPKNQFELIDAVPPDQLALWDALYTDREFLERETIKAFQYYKNNPKKTPKTIRGWRAALSSWFERGWVRHVTKIKSVSKNGSICGISYDV